MRELVRAAVPRSVALGWACLVVLSAGSAFLPLSVHAKETICRCKTISAEGYGSSSCSANESGGTCRIEYNEFSDEVLLRAQELFKVAKVTTPQIAGFGPRSQQETAFRVAALPPEQLVGTLLVYLAVSATHGGAFTAEKAQALGRALAEDGRVVKSIVTAFDKSAVDRGMSDYRRDEAAPADVNELKTSSGRALGVVSRGCLAVQIEKDWYMYKAFWSPARTAPQCGVPK
jgi:hypothetical protein